MGLIIVVINKVNNFSNHNNMKKLISFCFVLMVLSTGAFSQKVADRFANLNLAEQQKTSIDSIRKSFNKVRNQIKNDTSLSEEQKAIKIKDMRKEQSKKVLSVLNTEQRQKLKEQTKASAKKEGE